MVLLTKNIKKIEIILIFLYKKIISPMLGPHCRFQPTCSEYALQALKKSNIITGNWLIIKRILRCHPLNLGGYDPVP
ncbi:membrane protein insertion efficiency factor YidD [Candidatus Tachikawaea gelatinosa]|uniref:Putative membrane protein insertion efficiency factor n=1 Tax=Candidatus Tachikawaea gelatinosa TaxID=1410383 RepID=A0A090APQ4_9ENTR|nr:membrane protein insertion efficiency factor YidD [Candidatus Tachikawaea gelatinosa]BAP58277.1 putative membrane protein insertionefficiency factor [Candidatus Tachikawaea gelatinosa]